MGRSRRRPRPEGIQRDRGLRLAFHTCVLLVCVCFCVCWCVCVCVCFRFGLLVCGQTVRFCAKMQGCKPLFLLYFACALLGANVRMQFSASFVSCVRFARTGGSVGAALICHTGALGGIFFSMRGWRDRRRHSCEIGPPPCVFHTEPAGPPVFFSYGAIRAAFVFNTKPFGRPYVFMRGRFGCIFTYKANRTAFVFHTRQLRPPLFFTRGQ